MRRMSICAEVIARTLKEADIGSVFGLPGGEVLTLIEALRREDISFVLTRHEATAAFMADVTGQITRRPGVCLSTLGPGATNLLSGVANAYLDRSPLLAITGQMSTEALPFCSHQRIDLPALFQPVTKAGIVMDAKDSRGAVGKAIAIATQGRRGPVHIMLPSNIARQEDEGNESREVPLEESSPVLNQGLLEEAVGELAWASHPLIILGIGVDPLATGEAINEFVEKTQIPVLTTPKAKGIVSESHPLFLATAGGMAADEVVLELMEKADLLVGIGFDPVESDKMWHRQKKLLSIANASIAEGDYAPALQLVGDVKVILGQILASYSPNHSWKEAEHRDFKSRMRAKLQPSASAFSKGLSPYHLTLKLRQILSPSAVLTTDVGAHKLLLGQLWEAYEPLTFFMSNGLSSMGYGFPAAMAARLQFPDREVVSVCGDGGFAMMLQDLETAVRLKLPLVCIVFCDNTMSLIRVVQSRREYPDYGVGFGGTNLAGIARGFGACGEKVDTLEDFERAVAAGLREKCPVVIEVPVDPEEYQKQI